MDATILRRILRRIVEIQIEQGDLLKRLNHSAAIYNANVHLYFSHDGKDLRDEPRREMDRIEEHIEQNQERLRGLVTELCKPPAPATV